MKRAVMLMLLALAPFAIHSQPVPALSSTGTIVNDDGVASAESALCQAGANTRYVKTAATGTGSGLDWTNALGQTFTPSRGNTYCYADGAYSGKTFSTANSGSTTITLTKATVLNHGTSTGWSDTMGDGEAAFSSTIEFRTANWIFDGGRGGGPDHWDENFGFHITVTTVDPMVMLGPDDGGAGNSVANNVTVSHAYLEGSENTGGGGSHAQDCISSYGGDSLHVSYSRLHKCGRCWIWFSTPNLLVEYSHLEIYRGTDAQHSEGLALYGDTGTLNIVRYNLMTHAESTGMVMWDNEDNTSSVLRFYGNVVYRPSSDIWVGGADVSNGVIGSWAFPTELQYNFLVLHNTFIDTDENRGLPGGSNSPVVTLGDLATGTGNEVKCNYFLDIGANAGGGGPWATVTHNHFNATTAIGTNTSSSSGDPFVDKTGFNFRMTVDTTACTDLGAPYNVDMYGTTRPVGAATRGAVQR